MVFVSGGNHGLGDAQSAVLAAIKHAGCKLLHRAPLAVPQTRGHLSERNHERLWRQTDHQGMDWILHLQTPTHSPWNTNPRPRIFCWWKGKKAVCSAYEYLVATPLGCPKKQDHFRLTLTNSFINFYLTQFLYQFDGCDAQVNLNNSKIQSRL